MGSLASLFHEMTALLQVDQITFHLEEISGHPIQLTGHLK